MKIDGVKIASVMESLLKKEIKKGKRKKSLKMAAFLVSCSPKQLLLIKTKVKTAKKIGIGLDLTHLKVTPSFEDFMHCIKKKSLDPKINGIFIQQPLPAQLSTDCLYDYIPLNKEIESHRHKSPFLPPIGLAVLTILKYIYTEKRLNHNLFIDPKKDRLFFKKAFKNKKVILINKGVKSATPIGKTLSEFKINYISINSKTPEPEIYYKEADIIITTAGKKVITAQVLKPGVILINVDSRNENTDSDGDYDEKEIKDIANFYVSTVRGIEPVYIVYLYKNLIEAAKLQ